jgi:hypothetical protein
LEKRSLIEKEIMRGGSPEKDSPPSERGTFIKTLIHLRRRGDGYFHVHPLHAMFSLVASFVLAVLIMLVFVSSAR